MNGIPTALIKSWKTKKLCHHVEERRVEENKLLQSHNTKFNEDNKMWYNKQKYYLGENFGLSLLSEICTHFGIMKLSFTATTLSH